MTSRDFCYWLQGFFEISAAGPTKAIDAAQAEIIQAHLALVFKHEIDPSMGGPEHQDELNKIHASIKTVAAKVDAHVAGPWHSSGKGPVMRC